MGLGYHVDEKRAVFFLNTPSPQPSPVKGGEGRSLSPRERGLGRRGNLLSEMTPDQYCQDKAAASGSSFYYSFMFLAPDKRRAITALYAFCREVDDVVDECSDENVARTSLAWWRTEVAAIYGGKPSHPICIALVPLVKQFNLPQEHMLEIIDGMEMDLSHHTYGDFKSLQLYCYRVASVVGLLAAEIFGYTDR